MSEMDYTYIAKYLSGELSSEEESRFEEVRKENLDFAQELEQCADLFNDIEKAHISSESYVEKAFKSQINRQNKTIVLNSQQRNFTFKNTAAAIIILLTACLMLIQKFNKVEVLTKSNIDKITLPDNSQVTLNRNSLLQYNRWYNKRNVFIKGEAFFDVAHNERRSFKVNTERSQVKVLGTSFYVSAYHPSELVKVKVISGSVELKSGLSGDNEDALYLTKGQMGELNYKNSYIKKHLSYNENDLAWNTGKLNFKAEKLTEVLKALQKTYYVHFKTNFQGVEELKFTGAFENAKIEDVIKTLAGSFGLEYTISANQKQVIFNLP